MTRMEEYHALLQELEKAPARLNSTVTRAKARRRRHTVRRRLGIPAASLGAACLCFVLLVNFSAPFALACSRIPIFKELAAAVAFQPSLSAAVEHDWVQPVGLTQSQSGVEMTIDSLIVDEKQLNIFYTTGGTAAPAYDVSIDVQGEGGSELEGFAVISSMTQPNGELQKITVDFTSSQGEMPDALRLVCRLFPYETADLSSPASSTPAAVFTFDLTIDPRFVSQGRIVELEQELELDGQRLLLHSVEIYPTHIRVNLEGHPDNTAWLTGLYLYAEDENGVRYQRPGGISATGDPENPSLNSFRLDSSFFSAGEHLTLCFTGAEWLDKTQPHAVVDLKAGTAEHLPQDSSLVDVRRAGKAVTLTFRAPMPPGEEDMRFGNLFTFSYFTPEGEERQIDSWSHQIASDLGGDGLPVDIEGYYDTIFTLEDYPWDTVELEVSYSRMTVFPDPVQVPVA